MKSTAESLNEARILVRIYAPISGQMQKQQHEAYLEALTASQKLLKSRTKVDQHRGESQFHAAVEKYSPFINGDHPTALATSLFIYQFSIFDAFIGRLLHEIYSKKPELVNSIEKSLTIQDIGDFKSIKEIKDYLIGKEIDSLRRDSYSEQFKTMENRFGIKTLRKYDNWSVFIEGSQRRHLFTHCDGIASQQYRTAVTDVGGKPEFKVGDKVGLDLKYFMRTNSVITETVLKLSLVLWRKFWPNEKNEQEKALNNYIVSSIENNQYSLAVSLGEFSDTYRISEEMTRRMIVINLAQAFKWKGNQTKCAQILDKEDWSACTNEFKLCVSVLRDEFDAACDCASPRI
jgi:hypothetical protein